MKNIDLSTWKIVFSFITFSWQDILVYCIFLIDTWFYSCLKDQMSFTLRALLLVPVLIIWVTKAMLFFLVHLRWSLNHADQDAERRWFYPWLNVSLRIVLLSFALSCKCASGLHVLPLYMETCPLPVRQVLPEYLTRDPAVFETAFCLLLPVLLSDAHLTFQLFP